MDRGDLKDSVEAVVAMTDSAEAMMGSGEVMMGSGEVMVGLKGFEEVMEVLKDLETGWRSPGEDLTGFEDEAVEEDSDQVISKVQGNFEN